VAAKIGRNDLCPCGSGKKFKHCHEGRDGELFALLQARDSGVAPAVVAPAAAAPQSVSAQLATGGSGMSKPVQPGQRGRAVPPAPSAPAGNGKPGKVQPQAQRGKGSPPKRK